MATESCMQYANEMSCDAQIGLAKAELADNVYMCNYSIDHPVLCERMHNMLDTDIEHGMWKSVGSIKRLSCFHKQPLLQDGPWKQQFHSLLGNRAFDIRFDESTKAKTK